MTLAADWVDYNARRHGHLPALDSIDTQESLTWTELEERVAAATGVLRDEFGITPGDRVAMIAESDIRVFILAFASMRLRAIFVPLNWRLVTNELIDLATRSAPSLVVHDLTWSTAANDIAEAVGVKTLSWGDSQPGNDFDVSASNGAAVRPDSSALIDDPAQILFTSGTTGKPKGALITRANLSWQMLNIAYTDSIVGPGDRMLSPLPLFHAGGLNSLANPILMSGGSVSVVRRFDPAQILSLLSDPTEGYTHFASVPTMLQMVAAEPGFATASFPALRHLQTAGGVATQDVFDAWKERGVILQPHYGGTEMGPAITAMPKEWAAQKPGSVGLPVRHQQVRLVAPEGGDVAVGEIGEIWVNGPSVTPGYFGNPEATGAAFTDGWYRTGDAARADADGFLYIVDRYKDMYKSGGENVFPAEVERILLEHPRIHDVVVIGVPHAKWGETGLAIVVSDADHEITMADIEEHCTGRIARYKFPRSMRLVDVLPRNATGKIVKSDMRKQFAVEQIS